MQLREAKLTVIFIGVVALLLQFSVATKSGA